MVSLFPNDSHPVSMFFPKKRDLVALCGPAGLLLVAYILVFLRQYFWFSNSFVVSWCVPFVFSVILSFHIRRRFEYDALNLKFLAIIGLPLLFFFLLRMAYPDFSWDIINYHFINAERAMNGYPFIKGDFFYLSYSNPASDMITGVFRHLFGHRLGTIVNLLALLWSAQILDKILTHYVRGRVLRYLIVSALLCFEGFTYQISNYWVDLLSIPIILELVYVLVFKKNKEFWDFCIIALLFGIALGLKLTNLYFLIPLALMLFVQFWANQRAAAQTKLIQLVVFTVIFFTPLVPYHAYIFALTGNPIYPHYNWYFQSDLFMTKVSFDSTLGPETRAQALIWPFVMLSNAGRLSPTLVWPLLTFIGYIASIGVILTATIFKNLTSKETKLLSVFFFLSVFIWSLVSGDFRYVYVFEAIGGVLIFSCLLDVGGRFFVNKAGTLKENRVYTICVLSAALVFCLKFTVTLDKALRFEWAGRPTIFHNFEEYRDNLKYVFNDHSLDEFLSEQDKSLLGSPKAWGSSSPVVSGYMVLLNNRIPYLDLHHLPMRGTAGSELFQETVRDQGPVVYTSLIREGVLGHDLQNSIKDLMTQGFKPLGVQTFQLPFYSHTPSNQIELTVLETIHETHEAELAGQYSREKIEGKKASLVFVEWLEGCSGLERHLGDQWRWCADEFAVNVKNYSDIPLKVTVAFDVGSTSETASNFAVYDGQFSKAYQIYTQATPISQTIDLAAGQNLDIEFKTDAPRLDAPQDPRKLHVRLTGFGITSTPLQR